MALRRVKPSPAARPGGRAHAELGRWAVAAADYARAVELGPQDGETWYRLGLARLALGDADGYRRTCARLLERVGEGESPHAAYWAARVSVLTPHAAADPAGSVRLAEKALARAPRDAGRLRLLGAALCRAGQYGPAVARLGEAVKAQGRGGAAWDCLFLALAHGRLGQAGEARAWLGKAAQRLDQAGRAPPGGDAPPWEQRLAGDLLRREAEALLRQAEP